jgi:flagellar motility protein MotE (MotC chaperone)
MLPVRLLPLTMFVAALLLTVKVNDVWTGYQHRRAASLEVAVSETQAQTQPAQGQAQQRPQPAPAPPAQPTTPVQAQQNQPARPIGQAGQPAGQAPAPAAQPTAPAQVQAQPPQPTARQDNKPLDPIIFSQSEIEILQNLSTRRKEIDLREDAVVKREVLLQAAEKRLEEKIGELRNIKGEIEALIRKYNEQEETELKSLVKIYETMKPKDAARIFDELDLKVLLQVFQRMKEAKTAPILASMSPARAKEVTTQLAERRDIPNANQ